MSFKTTVTLSPPNMSMWKQHHESWNEFIYNLQENIILLKMAVAALYTRDRNAARGLIYVFGLEDGK
ncbi:hypothetical protein BC937DRAFT_93377 [Endogone sp. FLAS-F59071]|nr:hypothetical protein BC937DRAFT_93377 [Endogone sp. FLAS-F59071]|eukprot:RUS21196.1 hypothetical protein BC937DRAFT_93377 [Endogone sp. FLAS-F59071]